MKSVLKLEEFALFLLFSVAFFYSGVDWWWYLVLILAPDLGGLGYLINPSVGAFTYNLLHHRGLGVVLAAVGFWTMSNDLLMSDSWLWTYIPGTIILAHASLDRTFGYGLKYSDSPDHTHLGWVGKSRGKNA